MLTHRNFVSAITTPPYQDVNVNTSDVHISYLPLPHVMERCFYMYMTFCGASIGFYRGDPLQLLEDVKILKPTFFISAPRVYNRIYDGVKAKISALTGVKKSFADSAI